MADLEFFWDPVCPFAWITSRWVEEVVRLRGIEVDWRFISLRMVNETKDYEKDFPAGYARAHGRGLEMLRVAAAARERLGRQAMGPLYTAYGNAIWMSADDAGDLRPIMDDLGSQRAIEPILGNAGLPTDLAAEAENDAWDATIRADTDEALARTGRDVGTPIITLDPPDGASFFGPVISRIPTGDDALRLWDGVRAVASVPTFAELKRSLREIPHLPAIERARR